MLSRALASVLVMVAAVACSWGGPSPARLDVPEQFVAIPGAATTDDAIRRLTEATLECTEQPALDGLDRWVCRADNSGVSDRAVYTVTLLGGGGRLHLVDAQVAAMPDAGPVEGLASFFIETVLRPLTPEVAADGSVAGWVMDHIDDAATIEIAGAQLRTRLVGDVIRLQVYGAP